MIQILTNRLTALYPVWGRRFMFGIGGATFVYVAYLVVTVPVSWEEFKNISLTSTMWVVGAQALVILALPIQWKVLQGRVSSVPLKTAFKVIVPNIYMAYFPLRGAVILGRMHAAAREGIPPSQSVASLSVLFLWQWLIILALMPVALIFLSGIFSVAVLASVALAVLLGLFSGRRWVITLILAFVRRATKKEKLIELGRAVTYIDDTLSSIVFSRAILVHSGIFLIVSIAMAYSAKFLFGDMGYSLGLLQLLLALFAATTVGALSHLPGGLVAQEASIAYLVSLMGVPIEIGVIAAFILRFLNSATVLALSGCSLLYYHCQDIRARASEPESLRSNWHSQ